MTPIVEVEGLTYDYPGKRALEAVSFALPAGSITALVGPNGAGKTTLMRCLAALDEPLRGRIALLGEDALADPPRTHARLGYLPDSFGLYDRLTVRRCLIHRAWAQGVPKDAVAARVQRAAERVELADRLEERAGSLSRGLRQRLAIAQAIIHEPPLLILDEPASGLDPEARLSLSHLLRALSGQGMTILVSSHILAELQDYSTHLMIIEGGRLLSFEALDAKAAEDGLVTVAVQLAGAVEGLAERLSGIASGIALLQGVEALDGGFRARVPDEPAAQAAVLRALVEAGLPVAAFAAEKGSLQEAYLRRVKEARQ